VLYGASVHGSIAMLEWLLTVTFPWASNTKQDMMFQAGCGNNLAVMQWLRAHDASWPTSFSHGVDVADSNFWFCWGVAAVQ
jgi:hypothetical protein